MKELRVLHVLGEIKFSGAEIMYANAAPYFQKKGCKLFAISTGQNLGEFAQEFIKVNIQVEHIPMSGFKYNPVKLYGYFQIIKKYIKEQNIDIIHIHRSKFSWLFSLVGYRTKIKTIRTIHNVFRHRKITWIKGYLERYIASKHWNTIYHSIGESVHKNELEYYKNDSIVVNNWYDYKRFYPLQDVVEKSKMRKLLNIPNDAFVVISTGGCSHVKNHHDIIKALKIVNNEINCLYLHLGQGHTENEEKELTRELELVDKVIFYGNKVNVRDYLICSDVYLMPSKFEGLGNAALEAMACGLPSILYNCPGLKDLIDQDDNGFLIEPKHELLAEKILFLEANRKVGKEKGDNSHQFVKNNYSVVNGADGIFQIYTK